MTIKAISRTLWRWTWATVALVLILVAVLFTLVRLAIPFAGEYRAEIEQMMTDYLGAPVQVAEFDVEWYRLGPRLRLGDVVVERHDGGTVRFDEAILDVGFSLATRELSLSNVALTGVDVQVRRDDDGQLWFWGVTIDPDGLRAALLGQETEPVDPDAPLGEGVEDLFAALLAVRRLQLLDLRVHVDDPDHGTTLVPQVNMHLRNGPRRHQLAVEVDLPDAWGDRLTVRVDAQSNGRDLPEDGRVHIEGSGLALATVHSLSDGDRFPLTDGTLDLAVWTDWRARRLTQAHVDVGLRDVLLEREGADPVRLARTDGKLRWQRRADGWQLHVPDLRFMQADEPLRDLGAFGIAYDSNGDEPRWRAVADRVLVDDAHAVARFLPLPDDLQETMAALRPSGELRDVRLSWESPDRFALATGFSDLGWQPSGQVPGISGLDGQADFTAAGGVVELSTGDSMIDVPDLFRAPLSLRSIEGPIRIDRGRESLRVQSQRIDLATPDLRASARLDLLFAADQSPWFDMQVDFSDGNAARTSHYLPVGVMESEVVDWLDTSIVDGHVTSGSMLLHGRGADFAYGDGSGVFEVDFDVRDMVLDYASGWPVLEELDAQVRFFGSSLAINARRARMGNVDFRHLEARFASLADGQLEIRSESRSGLSDMIDVVNNSPLQDGIGRFFAGSDGTNEATLALALDIPVMRAEQTAVNGALHLDDNRLHQPRFGIDLGDITGVARFTESSLTLEEVDATLRDRPVHITGWTDAEGLHIHTRGDLAAGDLVPALAEDLAPWFDGVSPWLIRVRVPGLAEGVADPRVFVEGESELVGMEVRIPAPLNKPAAVSEAMRFVLPIHPDEDRHRLDIALGERFNLALELELPGDGTAELIRGTAHLGPELATLRTEGGLFIDGRVGAVEVEPWLDAVERLAGDAGANGAADPGDSVVSGTDLIVDELVWRDRRVTSARFQLRRTRTHWNLDLASDQATGELTIPSEDAGRDSAWRARFAYLDLGALQPERDGEADDESVEALPDLDPATLPALDLRIDLLRVGDVRIEQVALLSRPTGDGLVAHHLQAGGRDLRFNGQGEWRLRGETHQTRLRVPLTASNLGDGLAAMGAETAFRGGSGRIVTEASWQGRPWEPDLPSLEGSIQIELQDGVIDAVEPGPARLIGLFSVLTIPRRLALDFSDMMERGFTYDRIDGRINLHDGNAHTRSLEMIGPPGRIRVSGRAGYVDEDFDQQIVYRPALSYSLPIVGTIFGGTGVGIAVLVAQGVLRGLGGSIDDFSELHYTLRGTWAEPELERVPREPGGGG